MVAFFLGGEVGIAEQFRTVAPLGADDGGGGDFGLKKGCPVLGIPFIDKDVGKKLLFRVVAFDVGLDE